MVVAPMMVLVTFQRLLHQASASCVQLRPCFCATLLYSATASRASDLLYLRAAQPQAPFLALVQA